MRALAAYVMRGRFQAAVLSSFFAVLFLILPPMGYVSGGIVALVTMRKGVTEGAVIAIIASIVLAILSQIITGNAVVALVFAVMVWLPVWILSVVLRQTISLPFTLLIATLICGVAVAMFHLIVGDPIVWWRNILDQVFSEAMKQQGMSPIADMTLMLENTPVIMTALMAAAFFVSMIVSLFLGRWWQAILFNPGGFQQEFQAFRIDKRVAAIATIILTIALITSTPGDLASDLSVIVSMYTSIAGVALVHHWVGATNANKAWLFVMYLLLAFVAPQVLVLLALLGFADAWLNIRRYYEKPAG